MKQKILRIWRSLSFRLISVMILLMWVLAWLFTLGFSDVILLTTSSREALDISQMVSWSLQQGIEKTEKTLQVTALSTRGRQLSRSQLYQLADSIQQLMTQSEIYILPDFADEPALDTLRTQLFQQKKMLWSQVYMKQDTLGHPVPVATCMIPLFKSERRQGRPYAVLCSDYTIAVRTPDYLENAAPTDHFQVTIGGMEKNDAVITLTDTLGRYISHPDTTFLLKQVSDADFSFSAKLFPFHTRIPGPNWDLQYIVDWKNGNTSKANVIRILLFMSCGIMFSLLAIGLILVVRWQIKPLSKMAEVAEMVAKGYFDTPLPKIWGNTEIKQLRDSFEQMQEHLVQYIADLKKSTELNVMTQNEMAIASDIQQGMIPKTFPAFVNRTDLDIYGVQTPAKQVGGDLYDFFIFENKLFFCIGDVSGKGIPAALFMTVVGHLFRHVGRHTMSPAVIVDSINIGLCQGNKRNMFCTLFCGILDLETHQLLFTNGGHNAPVLIRKEGKPEFLQTQVNLPCGAFEESVYAEQQIQLNPGDSLFLYTDGITEAEDFQHQFYGEEAMMETLGTTPMGSDMKQLVEHLLDSIHEFTMGAEQSDDITVLSIKINE